MLIMRIRLLVLTGLLLAVSMPALGEDTDIYVRPTALGGSSAPNVLIILDNSGSMNGTTTPAYDPKTKYAYAGAGTAFDPTKIYWVSCSKKGGKTKCQSLPTSANTYPGQWFSASNNYCGSSTVPNAYSTFNADGLDESDKGLYADYAAGWGPVWSNMTAGDRIVECGADKPADSGTGNTYAYAGSSTTKYTSNSSQQVSWTSMSYVQMYSGNYLNYRNNPGASAARTKIDVAKEAVNAIVDANPNLRFGLMTFNEDSGDGASDNNGGRVAFRVTNMDSATLGNFHTVVNSMVAATWTPLAETMYEAYLYLSGQTVLYGNSTNPTNPVKDVLAQSGGKYISPINLTCQRSFIIYVTDGDPTNDHAADSLISGISGIASDNGNGSLLDELSEWMYKHDVITGTAATGTSSRNIITYTVGFGTGISTSGQALLQSTAQRAGGSYYTATDSAELTDALQSALSSIALQTGSFSAPTVSVNAFNRLFNRDEVYFAMFEPKGTVAWNGNVKKFKLDASGTIMDNSSPTPQAAIDTTTGMIKSTAKSYWSASADGNTVTAGGAGSKVPAYASRVMYTYTGGYPISTPVDLTVASNAISAANAAATTGKLTNTMLGLPAGASDTDRLNLVNWILGKDIYDSNSDGSTTDSRWAFGDPLHSRPVTVNFGGTSTSPIIKIFVGTNDGALRMINESTGEEEWSFIPPELLSLQYDLSQGASGSHVYGMDGTPTFWIQDANNDGVINPATDKVYMFVGMRRGGRNIYAFDVTPDATITDQSVGHIKPKLMWVIRGGVDASYLQLGYTWSRPQVATIRVTCTTTGCNTGDTMLKTVLIFSGGYDPHQDNTIPTGADQDKSVPRQGMGNAIYIADPTTGARLWWASGDSDATPKDPNLTLSGMSYSMPADLRLIDTDGDSAIDRVYAVDTGGQIWRIDLSNTLLKSGNANSGTRGYAFAKLSDCSSATQDCRKFFYRPDFAQVQDTSYSSIGDYDILTIESGDREDPLDYQTANAASTIPAVHNRLYALRDYATASYADTDPATVGLPTAITESKLYDATADILQSTATPGYTAALASLQAAKGWYINLKDSVSGWIGEKGLAETTIFAGNLFATTYVPPSSASLSADCTSDGTGYVYVVNLLDGTAVTDFKTDHTLNADDRRQTGGSGIPSNVVVVVRDSGVTGLIGTSGGSKNVCMNPDPNDPTKCKTNQPIFNTYWH